MGCGAQGSGARGAPWGSSLDWAGHSSGPKCGRLGKKEGRRAKGGDLFLGGSDRAETQPRVQRKTPHRFFPKVQGFAPDNSVPQLGFFDPGGKLWAMFG